MGFLKIIETLLNKKYPSLEKDNIGLILAITGLATSIGIMGIRYFIKYIKYDLFDLKLLHKKNQTFIPFIRNIILMGFLIFYLLLFSIYCTFIISFIPTLKEIINILVVVLLIVILLLILIILIDLSIYIIKKMCLKKPKKLKILSYLKTKITINSTTLISYYLVLTSTLLTINLMLDINLISIIKQEKSIKSVEFSDWFDILLFCILPPVTAFLYSYLTKNKYSFKLVEVLDKLPEDLDLYLDYFINENTSLFSSEDNKYKVIKKLVGEKQLYEVYLEVKKEDLNR